MRTSNTKLTPSLTVEVIKHPCNFTLHIEDPLDTVRRIAAYLQEKRIIVETFQMHRYRSGEANLMIQCQLEKEKIEEIFNSIKKIPGVIQLEKTNE